MFSCSSLCFDFLTLALFDISRTLCGVRNENFRQNMAQPLTFLFMTFGSRLMLNWMFKDVCDKVEVLFEHVNINITLMVQKINKEALTVKKLKGQFFEQKM